MTEDDTPNFDITVDSEGVPTTDSDDDGFYANEEKSEQLGRRVITKRGDSADEIDPRKLVRDPELSELRWYYRRTFAKKLVNKPIEDAFKNGFDLSGPQATRARGFLDDVDYLENYMMAEKKARRDGFALLFLGMKDTSPGVHVSPNDENVQVTDMTHTKVLRIDDLRRVDEAAIADQVQASYGESMTPGNYHVRETGIVISTDINSPKYREPIGYVLDDGGDGQFIHADRVQHMVWNPEVDGDYHHDQRRLGVTRFRGNDRTTLGEWEGDSILVQSYDLMKGLSKGNWAIMQALFRHAANMYAVFLPRDATEEDMNNAETAMTNLNAKSELFVPGGPNAQDEDSYEIKQFESGDMFEPREHFDVIFDQVCATHEMTKSVLFGTQAGTVSGSETDIKNYFNKVERYRRTRAENFLHDFVSRSARMIDGRTNEDFTLDVDIDWGPLFRVSQAEALAAFQTQAQAMGTLINGYVLTPNEARNIISEEWAEIDLDDITEAQMDELDRIQLMQVGQGLFGAEEEREAGNRAEPEGGPANNRTGGQNGGGMEQGQQTGEFADMDESDDSSARTAESRQEEDDN